MDITLVSDLHGYYPKLDGGDLLIIAGDLHARDEHKEHIEFAIWLQKLDYKKKIVIGGNHDNFLSQNVRKGITVIMPSMDCHYLCDSGTKFEGLKIWGSPWTATFPGMNPRCMAFTLDTEEQLKEKWDLIPDDVDILVTHSPPFGQLDQVGTQYSASVGSMSLLNKVIHTKIRLHVFGHIHENGGRIHELVRTEGLFQGSSVKFVNAALMNEYYEPVNKPMRIKL